MTIVTNLQTEDTALRENFADNPEAVEASQIDALLASVQQAGQTTSGIQERGDLLQILKFWVPIVEEKTGEHPETKLSPYDPAVEVDEEEIADEETAVPTPIEETDDIEPTATYIPGGTEGDSPQTLAQLFMTMPTWAKVAILVLIALILAGIIYWILSPKSEQAATDMPGTETAVAAAITASAQPTGTNTPTATPPIYIESETSVAQSAPVGSPTPIIYIIQKGDTLNSVSRKYGVPVQDIVALNNIYNPNSIPIGQELLIPTPGAGTSMPADNPSSETSNSEVTVDPNATPTAQQDDANEATSQTNTYSVSELVIHGADSVELRIAAGPDYQAITTLPQGTFATIVAQTPDGVWYLVQLEDGFTRGWVPAEYTAILYPGNPDTIPTTPMP